MAKGMIAVMIPLHFLPRFQQKPKISDFYEQLTGKNPTSLKVFVEREKNQFEKQPARRHIKPEWPLLG